MNARGVTCMQAAPHASVRLVYHHACLPACLLLPAFPQGTAGGFAVQFGASKDSQTAADTQALAGACG